MRAFVERPRSKEQASSASSARAVAIPPLARDALQASGRPLEPSTRQLVEPRFGHDFSQVRVHTDARAAAATSALAARAFTVHRDIVFGAGEYAPQTASGSRLLAHELTHVVQQRAGAHPQGGVGRVGDPYERHADAVADRVVQGKQVRPLLDERAPAGGSHGAGDFPLQMQAASQPGPQQPKIEDPKAELLRATFQKLLAKSQLNEKVNGALARAVAQAYVHRPRPIHATQYVEDRVSPGIRQEPSENEVYQAILAALDVQGSGGTGDKASDWVLKPAAAPGEGTRGPAAVEIAKYGAASYSGWKGVAERVEKKPKNLALDNPDWGTKGLSVGARLLTGGDPKDIAIDQAKDLGVEVSAKWLAGRGLLVLAEMVTGAYEIYGAYELLRSTLELAIQLTKPVRKEMSKSERIADDVRNWLLQQQLLAQAAAAPKEPGLQPFKPEIQIMAPDHTAVRH